MDRDFFLANRAIETVEIYLSQITKRCRKVKTSLLCNDLEIVKSNLKHWCEPLVFRKSNYQSMIRANRIAEKTFQKLRAI